MTVQPFLITGEASDGRERFEFKIEPYLRPGFLLTISFSGDGRSNVTGGGVWPTVEKAKQIAEETASRLLHGSKVSLQASRNITKEET